MATYLVEYCLFSPSGCPYLKCLNISHYVSRSSISADGNQPGISSRNDLELRAGATPDG